MPEFQYMVAVIAPTQDQADAALAERIDGTEIDMGFEYEIRVPRWEGENDA